MQVPTAHVGECCDILRGRASNGVVGLKGDDCGFLRNARMGQELRENVGVL